MAKRSSTRRTPARRAPSRRSGSGLTRAQWSWIGGLLVFGVALFTLLSLLSRVQGPITRGWLDLLRGAIGWGTYLVPLLLGVLAVAIVTRASTQPLRLPLPRVAGVLLLLISALALTHHLGAGGSDVTPGGALGRGLSALLGRWLGWGGGVVVLITLAGIALILALDISWAEAIVDTGRFVALFVGWMRVRWTDMRRRRATVTTTLSAADADAIPATAAPTPASVALPLARPSERATLAAPPRQAPAASPSPAPQGLLERVPDALPPASAPSFGAIYTERPVRWQLPHIETLFAEREEAEMSIGDMREKTRIIEETLRSLGAPVTVVEVNPGPVVTQFGLEPGYVERRDRTGEIKRSKVKVSRIQALSNDLALALAASPLRIEAPVPGKAVVGLEIPNPEAVVVGLRAVLESEQFAAASSSPLALALGRDVSGTPVVSDLAKLPHLLIAGATGSGKSVCINTIVASLLCRCTPDELRLLMIDPKRVELSTYNGIPHLLAPVVVETDRVVGVLNWVTREMDRRYRTFAAAGARNLEAYNARAATMNEPKLPLIVCFIDELADLMMAAPDEVERAICRIAQMARATGIHLVIATQRPSVDVVTGLIKANFPARIAFAVSSQTDSRVILDSPGADKLLGRGDALLMSPESAQLQRMQGCYVSDAELAALVAFWRAQQPGQTGGAEGLAGIGAASGDPLVQRTLWPGAAAIEEEDPEEDPLMEQATALVTAEGRASVSFLQRRLRIGYSRAARLMDALEQRGIVGPANGGKARDVAPSAAEGGDAADGDALSID